MTQASAPTATGTAYIDGRYMPVAEAAIPITDWGYRCSDVTYDVVGVWQGKIFRLDDHIRRFRASTKAFRFQPRETDENIKVILHCCLALSGLRDAYVAMDCLPGRPPAGARYHPAYARNYIATFAVPWISLLQPDVKARRAHLVVAETVRIPSKSVDPTAKNFDWADLTQGQFEAHDRSADFCVLLAEDSTVAEGPGFNIFVVSDRRISTPVSGVLEGITRRSVIELFGDLGLPIEVRPVPVAELRGADEIFLSITAGGVMPAARIDGRIMSNDRPGPISRQVHDAFWSRRAEGWHATPVDYAAGETAAAS
jgi:branched-chain amino acid aminotransferase